MKDRKPLPIQRDWLSKTLAGAILGFSLGLGCSGLFSRLNMDMALAIRAQLCMWMVIPVWLGTLSTAYLFRSGFKAWGGLAGANVLVFSLLLLVHQF